jgi:hypothetical protein
MIHPAVKANRPAAKMTHPAAKTNCLGIQTIRSDTQMNRLSARIQ